MCNDHNQEGTGQSGGPRRPRRATIADVAREAGVSAGLVSRILNHDETLRVRPQTTARVLEAAEKLDYRAMRRARPRGDGGAPVGMPGGVKGTETKAGGRRRTRRGRTMLLVQWRNPRNEERDYYYLRLRQSAQQRLEELGYNVTVVYNTSSAFPDLPAAHADGIIAVGVYTDSQLAAMRRKSGNLIMLGMDTLAKGISCVAEDYLGAAQETIRFLIMNGIRRIGLLNGSEYSMRGAMPAEPRFIAFREHMEAMRIYDPKLAYIGEFTAESGYALMKEAISDLGGALPHAFVAMSDALAVGALHALADERIPVPDRVAIIGFDGSPACLDTLPTISSVRVPVEDMGVAAAMMAHDGATGAGPAAPHFMRLATRLELRGSTPDDRTTMGLALPPDRDGALRLGGEPGNGPGGGKDTSDKGDSK